MLAVTIVIVLLIVPAKNVKHFTPYGCISFCSMTSCYTEKSIFLPISQTRTLRPMYQLTAKTSPESPDRPPTQCSVPQCISFQDENSDSKPLVAEQEHRLHCFVFCSSPKASPLCVWRGVALSPRSLPD